MLKLVHEERPDLIDPSRSYEQFYGVRSRVVNGLLMKKALEFIKENPWRILRLKALNILYLFHPRLLPFYPMGKVEDLVITQGDEITVKNLPSRSHVAEWVHAVYSGVVLLTAILGVVLRRHNLSRDFMLWIIVFNFVVVYSIYWPATSYRAPMDFILMFYSACAISRWNPQA